MTFGGRTRLLALVMGLALPALSQAAAGQERAQEDTVPTLEGLSVRILKLKVQLQTLRARLSEDGSPLEGGGPAAGRKVWSDSVASMRAAIAVLKTDAGRLGQAYRRVKHAEGARVARQLGAMIANLEQSGAALAGARDAHAARIQITHLTARLDAMLERVAEAEKCCRITLEQ